METGPTQQDAAEKYLQQFLRAGAAPWWLDPRIGIMARVALANHPALSQYYDSVVTGDLAALKKSKNLISTLVQNPSVRMLLKKDLACIAICGKTPGLANALPLFLPYGEDRNDSTAAGMTLIHAMRNNRPAAAAAMLRNWNPSYAELAWCLIYEERNAERNGNLIFSETLESIARKNETVRETLRSAREHQDLAVQIVESAAWGDLISLQEEWEANKSLPTIACLQAANAAIDNGQRQIAAFLIKNHIDEAFLPDLLARALLRPENAEQQEEWDGLVTLLTRQINNTPHYNAERKEKTALSASTVFGQIAAMLTDRGRPQTMRKFLGILEKNGADFDGALKTSLLHAARTNNENTISDILELVGQREKEKAFLQGVIGQYMPPAESPETDTANKPSLMQQAIATAAQANALLTLPILLKNHKEPLGSQVLLSVLSQNETAIDIVLPHAHAADLPHFSRLVGDALRCKNNRMAFRLTEKALELGKEGLPESDWERVASGFMHFAILYNNSPYLDFCLQKNLCADQNRMNELFFSAMKEEALACIPLLIPRVEKQFLNERFANLQSFSDPSWRHVDFLVDAGFDNIPALIQFYRQLLNRCATPGALAHNLKGLALLPDKTPLIPVTVRAEAQYAQHLADAYVYAGVPESARSLAHAVTGNNPAAATRLFDELGGGNELLETLITLCMECGKDNILAALAQKSHDLETKTKEKLLLRAIDKQSAVAIKALDDGQICLPSLTDNFVGYIVNLLDRDTLATVIPILKRSGKQQALGYWLTQKAQRTVYSGPKIA